MIAFAASFVLIALAEMGDKTQLLAIAFAMKYSASKVLLAIFLATLLSQALAVAAGRFLTTVIPTDAISFAAAVSFIIFGLWSIRPDNLEGEGKKESKFGPIITVGAAFFLAEMGDKTQLATISLAVKYQNMVSVLMGTTLAMVFADAAGIIFGKVLHKHIPAKTIRWIAAFIFILFGLIGVYQVLSGIMPALYLWVTVLLIGAGTVCGGYYFSRFPGNPKVRAG